MRVVKWNQLLTECHNQPGQQKAIPFTDFFNRGSCLFNIPSQRSNMQQRGPGLFSLFLTGTISLFHLLCCGAYIDVQFSCRMMLEHPHHLEPEIPERMAPLHTVSEKEDREREERETERTVFSPRLRSEREKHTQETQAKKRKQPDHEQNLITQVVSFADLPKHVLKKVAGLLDPPSLCSLSLVCRALRLISDGSPWRAIYIQRLLQFFASILWQSEMMLNGWVIG